MRREKLIISLVLIVMIVLLGTVSSYAVEITSGSIGTNTTGSVTITPTTNTAAAGNTTIRPVNATNTGVVNSTVNTYSNTGTSTNTTKSSSNSTGLPYAGSGSIAGAFLVVVVLLGSSIFAYKKVSEYNV